MNTQTQKYIYEPTVNNIFNQSVGQRQETEMGDNRRAKSHTYNNAKFGRKTLSVEEKLTNHCSGILKLLEDSRAKEVLQFCCLVVSLTPCHQCTFLVAVENRIPGALIYAIL
jgi:hypothetical protein